MSIKLLKTSQIPAHKSLTTGLVPVEAIKPAAPYQGGKKLLARTIIDHINQIPHRCYAEPFVGMGGVFFRRTKRPNSEVINDLNGEVANFFRILQRHYAPFADMLQFQLSSRQEFRRLQACDPATLTDLERAARFVYLQKLAYGGKVCGQAFGLQRGGHPARFNFGLLNPALKQLHGRLSRVVIECLPYQEFINRYDHATTLFYLDPPYWGTEDCYGKNLFSRSDFAVLAEQLALIKGRFVLSLNDRREVRQLFSGFHLSTAPVSYSLSKTQPKASRELIISNFP